MAEPDAGVHAAPDAVVFRRTTARTVLMLVIAGAAGLVVARLLLGVGFGQDFTAAFWWEFLAYGMVYVVVSATLGGWLDRRRPNWVRTSAAGVELAGARRQAVFVPWSAVAAVRLRWFGLLTVLEVTPTDLAEVATASPGGWGPRIRRRDGRPTIVVEAGLLKPGTARLRAELIRRLPDGVALRG